MTLLPFKYLVLPCPPHPVRHASPTHTQPPGLPGTSAAFPALCQYCPQCCSQYTRLPSSWEEGRADSLRCHQGMDVWPWKTPISRVCGCWPPAREQGRRADGYTGIILALPPSAANPLLAPKTVSKHQRANPGEENASRPVTQMHLLRLAPELYVPRSTPGGSRGCQSSSCNPGLLPSPHSLPAPGGPGAAPCPLLIPVRPPSPPHMCGDSWKTA